MYLHLNLLANTILNQYFNATNCLLIFSDNYNFNYNGKLPFINIQLRNKKFDPGVVFNYFGCQGIVMNTKTPVTTLMFLEDQMRHNLERFNFRRYLFLPTDDMQEDFVDVLDMMEVDYIADLLIIYPDKLLNAIDMMHMNGGGDIMDPIYDEMMITENDYELEISNEVSLNVKDEMIKVSDNSSLLLQYLFNIVLFGGDKIDTMKSESLMNLEMGEIIMNSFMMEDDVAFHLITHSFVGMNKSHDVVLLDRWNNYQGFIYGNYLYPDKIYNGQGRAYRIATFTYEPYSVVATHEGTELQLAIEFAKNMNLKPELVVDEEGEWGEIYDNWTGYGILGNVMYDHGDVGLGALYTWAHEYLYLDLSKPVVRTGITCLAPAPTLAGGWLVPLFSFTYEMWIAVALSFLLCTMSIFLLELYKSKSSFYEHLTRTKRQETKNEMIQQATLKTSGIFLLQSQTHKPVDNTENFIFGCMIIFSLLLATTYSSGLASSMTVPRYTGAIRTVQDLVDSGIQWGATSIAWIMSIMGATEPNYLMLLERFVKTTGEHLKMYNNKRFAFSIERLPAGYYAIGNYITEDGVNDLRIMTEDLYWEQCVLMTKKSSVWMPALDDFILKLAETGIQSVWEFKTVTTHLNPKIQRAVKFSSHHNEQSGLPLKLKWGHVQGAFGVLIIGVAFGFAAFAWEHLSYKRNNTNIRHI